MTDKARCLGCGYLLRDLPGTACPECGRKFDPADPATFDANPVRTRRRRWVVRAMVLAALIGAGYALYPSRTVKSSLMFTCNTCGRIVTVTRRQWIPRPWIPFGYPSYTSTSTSPGVTVGTGDNDNDAESSRTVCTDHIYAILADLRTRGGGGFYAPLRETATSVLYINGQRVTPETAGKILEDYMTANAGFSASMRGR